MYFCTPKKTSVKMDKREKGICRVTIAGSICNAILLALKFIAGIVGHSGAMIADAIHSFSDFVTDAVVLVFINISAKPSDESHDYGHGKFETLATSIIAIALFAVAIGILVKSATAIADIANGGVLPQPGMIAFLAAAISIAVKEGLFWYTISNGKKWNSQAVIANAWHHRSDALSSIATLIGIGCAYFIGGKWTIMDPIAALVVGAMILKVAFNIFIPAINELLECSLPKETEDKILQIITTDTAIQDPHKLRTRRIGSHIAIDVHIRLDGEMTVTESHDITVGVENRLKAAFGNSTMVSIHVEPIK